VTVPDRVFYVGCITEPGAAVMDGPDDELLIAVGRHMDDGRVVKFRASRKDLWRWHADDDEDAYLVVRESDVIKISGRYGRDLWTNAGLPWSIG
jgi:hypothetical protein